MNLGSSTRLTGAPSTSVVISRLLCRNGGGRALAHGPGGLADRQHDVVVARAAAEVALDRVPNLLVGRIVGPAQQVGGGHDHAGGAEPALEPVLLPERALERVKVVGVTQALDGRHAAAVCLRGEHRAALHGSAVEVDRACAALAGVAPDVGAGQAQVLAQHLDQQPSRLDVHLPAYAVHLERYVQLGHRDDLLPCTGAGLPPV